MMVMEAARTSETLVNFYQITRRCNPEDSHLRYTVFLLLNIPGSCCFADEQKKAICIVTNIGGWRLTGVALTGRFPLRFSFRGFLPWSQCGVGGI
jgi:hypothetical protein